MISPYPEALEAWGYSRTWHKQFETAALEGSFPARVVRDHRGYFRVHTAKGELIATTAGRLKHNAAHASDLHHDLPGKRGQPDGDPEDRRGRLAALSASRPDGQLRETASNSANMF